MFSPLLLDDEVGVERISPLPWVLRSQEACVGAQPTGQSPSFSSFISGGPRLFWKAPSTHCLPEAGSPKLGSLTICFSSLEGGQKSSFWDNLLVLPDPHRAPLTKPSCSLLPSGSKAQGGGLLGRHNAVLEAAADSLHSLWHTGGPEGPLL